LKDQIVGLFKF